jgi:uncharacterized membrane protein
MTGSAAPGAGFAAPRAESLDRWIARVLRVGTGIGMTLLAIGVVLLAASGRSPLDASWHGLDLARLVTDVPALRPEGFLWLGLLVTLATPLLRVAAAIVGFLGAGERRMAGLGLAVLVVIASAVLVAHGTAP